MKYGVGAFSKGAIERPAVANIALDEAASIRNGVTVPGAQIVDDRNIVPVGDKTGRDNGPDVSCSARHTESHAAPRFVFLSSFFKNLPV